MTVAQHWLTPRRVRALTVALVVWCLAWAAAGVLLWRATRVQARLSGDVATVGRAVRETGEALGAVGALPLVGARVGAVAAEIESMGREVETSGELSAGGIRSAAVALGVGTAVVPSVLLAVVLLPAILGWRRDVAAVAAALAAATPDERGLDAWLAQRALQALPWQRLRAVCPDPVGALAAGDREALRALADAELARLGLERPR